MALIKVPTSFNIEVEFEIPEFYRRLLSLIIDMGVELAYLILSLRFISAVTTHDPQDENAGYNIAAIQMLVLVPMMIYHVVLEITMNGQSIGKKLMGIRVVNENGGKPGISQFIIRWLLRISDVWIVSLLLLVATGAVGGGSWEVGVIVLLALGFLITDIVLVASSKKGQRIGDMLAKTILIRTHSKASIEDTVFQEVEESYTPVFPEIMRLSDRDINAIKSILESSRKRNDQLMAATAADKIKNHLQISSELDPQVFLEILLKDYNYLSVK